MEPFEIRYGQFDKMYLRCKTQGYDSFKLKIIETQSDTIKYDFNNPLSGLVLSKIKSKVIKDINLYDRVNKDNYYLKGGGDIYEVLHSYFIEVEKTVYKAIKREYEYLLKSKGLIK